MTDQMQAIRDDLAFMREMTVTDEAAASRKAGAILTTAGIIFAGASVEAWAASASLAPTWTMAWVWPASMVLFLAVLGVILSRGPKAQGVRDRTAGMAWTAIGWAISAIMLGFTVASFQLHSSALFAGAPTVILALYGAGWTVAATVSNRRWMWTVAFGGYLGAVAIGLLVNNPAIYLVYAVALLMLTAAPGVVLLRSKD